MYWVQVIADIVHYVLTVFGCPSYFTDGGDIILNDSVFYIHLLLYSVKFEKYLIKKIITRLSPPIKVK